MTKNNALLWLHQVKLCRFFRYSAFRGWHRSDCALLALSSPKFSVKHRSAARYLLFFCKSAEYLLSHSSMGGICVEGHVEFVFSLVPKHCREWKISLKIGCRCVEFTIREAWRFPYCKEFFYRENTYTRNSTASAQKKYTYIFQLK